jgi:diguanylate cyclase (GGDEF)-like protein
VRLQIKLFLALLPLIALPLVALGWLSWSYLGADLQREATEDLERGLHQAERAVADLIENAASSLELLALAPETERYARADHAQDRYFLFQAPLLKLFQDYRNTYPDYLMIRFLMPDGREDGRAAAVEGIDPAADAPFEVPLYASSGITGLPRFMPEPDRLEFYRRVELSDQLTESRTEQYQLYGYIALTVSLSRTYERLSETGPVLGGQLLLLSADGKLLFATGAGPESMLPAGLEQQLSQFATPDAESALPLPGQTTRLHWDGRDWFVKAHPLGAGLNAVAVMPAAALSHPLKGLALKTVLITLVSGLLLGLVLFLLLRRLVLSPLDGLRAAARAIGAGSLTPEIAVQSRDEIGLLADDVREMGQRLSRYRRKIEDLAFNDQLTGLPNRHLTRELVKTHLQGCDIANAQLAVLLLDIDNFKQINDSLGHAWGDQLIKQLAERLCETLRTDALSDRSQVARLGGDEFLLLIDRLRDDAEPRGIAEQILVETTRPFEFDQGHYVVTASIGIALFPRDANDADELIRSADLAMYQAKAIGRNTYREYSPDLQVRVSERLLLEHRLRCALAESRLRLEYQPLVSIDGLRLVGFEALTRWTDPELGPIAPTRFIPIAEQTGLIEELGDWVLSQACAQLAQWRAAGLAVVPVAINLSPVQLLRGAPVERVAANLEQWNLAPELLQIEITESVLMDLSPINSARLKGLAALGVALHIDDFGTGYSSISYLRRFEIDCIKIDRSFVSDICSNREDRALVAAMIAMASALGVKVIAEGIETHQQLEQLRALNCDYGQGYLFARPGPVAEAERLLCAGQIALPAD